MQNTATKYSTLTRGFRNWVSPFQRLIRRQLNFRKRFPNLAFGRKIIAFHRPASLRLQHFAQDFFENLSRDGRCQDRNVAGGVVFDEVSTHDGAVDGV